MKINRFLIGFGLGGLIATYICEWLYKKYDASTCVIELQNKVINMMRDDLYRAYDKIEKLERMEDDLK